MKFVLLPTAQTGDSCWHLIVAATFVETVMSNSKILTPKTYLNKKILIITVKKISNSYILEIQMNDSNILLGF